MRVAEFGKHGTHGALPSVAENEVHFLINAHIAYAGLRKLKERF